MKVASSEFRKRMFDYLGQAVDGNVIDIVYKGRSLRLVPEEKQSITSRLVKRNTIIGTPENLDAAQRELDDELRSSWEAKWDKKL